MRKPTCRIRKAQIIYSSVLTNSCILTLMLTSLKLYMWSNFSKKTQRKDQKFPLKTHDKTSKKPEKIILLICRPGVRKHTYLPWPFIYLICFDIYENKEVMFQSTVFAWGFCRCSPGDVLLIWRGSLAFLLKLLCKEMGYWPGSIVVDLTQYCILYV